MEFASSPVPWDVGPCQYLFGDILELNKAYKPNLLLPKNVSLVSSRFVSETCGATDYGIDWRKDVVNQSLESE